MANHVSHCMARAYACRTHGKPCVWHMACHVSSCMALLEPIYRGGVPIQLMEAQIECMGGAARRRMRKGIKEKGRRGKEKGRKGKEKGRKRKEKERRKEKKKGEEERKKKEEKEGVLRSEQTRTKKSLELHYKR